MSGSEQRVRNYRTGARLSPLEKQQMIDLVKALGFQTEGDMIRYFFFGTQPFKPVQLSREILFESWLAISIAVMNDGTLRRSEYGNI